MLQRGLVCSIQTSFQKASQPKKHCFLEDIGEIYVPVPGPRTPPPPPNGMVPPFPRIIRILGMMLAMLGMLSSTVRALQLRSQTPFHPVNQHPRTSRNILP